jgi:hypothetical protein
MSIKYTLNIGNVTKKFSVGEFSDVIINANVNVNAYSEEYPEFTYNCGSQIQFSINELEEENFVSFEDVTKEDVLGWILSQSNVETVEEYSYVKSAIDNIQGRIDALQEEENVSTGWTITNDEQSPEVLEP